MAEHGDERPLLAAPLDDEHAGHGRALGLFPSGRALSAGAAVSCTLATIAACLAGFYIDAGAGWHDNGVETWTIRTQQVLIERPGLIETQSRTFIANDHRAQNPYVRVVLGYERPVISEWLFLYGEASHTSSVATGRDRGVNAAYIGFRAYPWGRR